MKPIGDLAGGGQRLGVRVEENVVAIVRTNISLAAEREESLEGKGIGQTGTGRKGTGMTDVGRIDVEKIDTKRDVGQAGIVIKNVVAETGGIAMITRNSQHSNII